MTINRNKNKINLLGLSNKRTSFFFVYVNMPPATSIASKTNSNEII